MYTIYGMDKVEEQFGSKLKDVSLNYDSETYVNKQQHFIYMHLKSVDNLRNMDEVTLHKEISYNCLGNIFEVIPQNMLSSTKVSNILVS